MREKAVIAPDKDDNERPALPGVLFLMFVKRTA